MNNHVVQTRSISVILIVIIISFQSPEFANKALERGRSISSTTDGSSITEKFHSNLDTNQATTDSRLNYSSNIAVDGFKASTHLIAPQSSIIFDEIKYDRDFTIKRLNSSGNNLDFENYLEPIMKDNTIGDLEYHFEDSFKSLDFEKFNVQYATNLETALNLDVSEIQFLELNLTSLYFDFTEADLSFASITFTFDTFKLGFIFAYSQLYLDLGLALNFTDSVKLLEPLNEGGVQVWIDEIIQQTSEEFPSILSKISVSVYSNSEYTFQASFSEIGLYLKKQTSSILINGLESNLNMNKTKKFQNTKYESVNITNPSPVDRIELLVIETLHWESFLPGKIDKVENILTVGFEQGEAEFVPEFSYNLSFGNGLRVINASSGDSVFPIENNVIVISNFKNKNDNIHIKCNYSIIENHQLILPELIQGQTFTLDPNGFEFHTGMVFHERENVSIPIREVNGYLEFDIPTSWPKGLLMLYFIDKMASLSLVLSELVLSPSKLISATDLEITPITTTVFEVKIANLTDGSIIAPKTLHSYLNGSLRSVDGQYGMILLAGEFQPGSYEIEVNATHYGLVPVEFILRLTVIVPIVNLEVTVRQFDNSTIDLNITISNFTQFSITPFFDFSFSNLNVKFLLTTSNTQQRLRVDNINQSDGLRYEYSLYFAEISFRKNGTGFIQPLQIFMPNQETLIVNSVENDSSPNSLVNLLAIIGVISIVFVLGLATNKVIREKLNSGKIKF